MKWLLMMGGRMKLKPILLLMLLLSGSLLFIPVPVHAAANASGLVGHWAFTEGSGTSVADLAGNGGTGTLVNSPTWTNLAGTGALKFVAASTMKVSVADSTSLQVESGAFTIFAAIKFTTVPAGGSFAYLVVKTNAAEGNGWGLAYDGSLGLSIVKFGVIEPNVAWTPTAGKTYHLMAVATATAETFYQNGTLIGSVSDSSSISSSSGDALCLACSPKFSSRYFNGIMGDVRIYNRALSASEDTKLSNGVSTLSAPSAAWDGIKILCDISCSSITFNTQGGGSTGAFPYLTFSTEYAGTEIVYLPTNMLNSGVVTGIAGVTNNNVANTASYTVGVSGYQFTASTGILIETGASTHEIDFQPGPNCNFCATGISINGQTTTTANPGGAGPPPILGGSIAVALALGAGVYIFMRRRGSEG